MTDGGEGGVTRVSVVIPNWNGGEMLAEVLHGLEAQEFSSFEVIVVDDASTDGSLARAQQVCRPFRPIVHERNEGFAASCNAGAAAASGELIAFLNNDAVPEPAWLRELVDSIDRHPEAACVDSKLYRRGSDHVIDGAGDEFTWGLKAYRRGSGARDDGSYSHEEQIFLASGAACIWRADAFRRLGGFAEEFFAYYEDVDLSLRARRAGYEIWFAPAAVAWHEGGAATAPGRREFDGYMAVRNRWATIVRNVPAWWFARRAPAVALGEVSLAARAIASGDGGPYYRALRAGMSSWPEWRRERRAIRATGELSPELVARFVERRLPPLGMSVSRWRGHGFRMREVS
ncbi:MAG TPA: glycosyltransferase family 2 protein [Gaiellaceae bacterium]